jgi:hypothetical protein
MPVVTFVASLVPMLSVPFLSTTKSLPLLKEWALVSSVWRPVGLYVRLYLSMCFRTCCDSHAMVPFIFMLPYCSNGLSLFMSPWMLLNLVIKYFPGMCMGSTM